MTQRKLSVSLALIWISVAIIVSGAVLSACSSEPADYLSWTKADWDKASDAEKTSAAEAVLSDLETSIRESLGDDAETNALTAEQLSETAGEMVDSIDQYFEVMNDATLQDLVDQTKALLGV